MTDVEIVLKIPQEVYEGLVYLDIFQVRNLIQKGTPLPKGHGRLIDADAYRKEMFDSREFDFLKGLICN